MRASRELARDKDADGLTDEGETAGDSKERLVRQVADKAFVLSDGRWLDTTWDGKQEPKKITAFSDEYFKLIEQHPDLRKYFSLGPRVLVILDQEAYETVPPPEEP